MVKRLSDTLCEVGREDGYSVDGQVAHWCPACNELHAFALQEKNSSGARWSWDGNVASPTMVPSMNISTGAYVDPKCEVPGTRCHYFLRGGVIEFLGDCTHGMRGQRVPLPPIPLRFPPDYVTRA